MKVRSGRWAAVLAAAAMLGSVPLAAPAHAFVLRAADPTSATLSVAVNTAGRLDFTATTDQAVNSTQGTRLGVYDTTTGQRVGYCNTGTVCTLTGVVPVGGGEHSFVAAAGVIPTAWTTPPGAWVVSESVVPPAWEVSLTSATASDGKLVFATTTNYPVNSSASILVGVYDRTTGRRLGTCGSGRTCTQTATVPLGAGEHQFVAAVGAIPSVWSDTDPGNWDVSGEITAPAWEVSLTRTTNGDGKLVFATTTNYPVNSSASILVGVYDRTTGKRLGTCGTGRTCTQAAVVPLGGGEHQFVAAVGTIPSVWSDTDPGNWDTSEEITAPAWSVTLTGTLAADNRLAFSTTTNYPVSSSASIRVGIYDTLTGERLATCGSGTTCSLSGVVPQGPGEHSFVAAAGILPTTWDPSSTGIWAVSAEVAAPAWAVSLTRAENNGQIVLSAATNYAVNGNASLRTGIYDVTTGSRLGYCSSGITCTLPAFDLPADAPHQYVAAAGDIPASWPGPGVWAQAGEAIPPY